MAHVLSWQAALPVPPEEAELVDELAGKVVVAAEEGKKLPESRAAISRYAEEQRVHELQAQAFELALNEVAQRLTSAVSTRAEEIVTDFLRPAFEDVLAKAKPAAEALKAYGSDPDPSLLIAAPQTERDAFGILQQLADRYAQIQSARANLQRISPAPVHDTAARFREFKNLPDVWPGVGSSFQGRPPWPESGVGRLVWICNGEAEPWFPTAAEQDARSREWGNANRQRNTAALAGAERA